MTSPARPTRHGIIDLHSHYPMHLETRGSVLRAMTLKNNLDLKVQLIEPTIAAKQVSAEEAKFESSFFANLSYSSIDQPSVIVQQEQQYKSQTADLGVQVPLQTGGTAKFDLADNRANITAGDFSAVSYTPVTTFSISQPLLRGAGKPRGFVLCSRSCGKRDPGGA